MKMIVNFFQRKPRPGFSFSLEYIFDDLRKRLAYKIKSNVYISSYYNDGYLSKFINIIEAWIRQGKDINHITGEVHFLDLLMKKKRVVLTIHDCGMIHRKSGWARNVVRWLYLRGPVSCASIVTTVSEMTKAEIVTYANCSPDKVRVIPVAVNPQYIPYPKGFNEEKPVILHIGTGYNKNLIRLIESLSGISCHLCIIGKISETHIQLLKKHNIEYSNEYNISNERMLEKYIACDILSFISTFEGFGMPIVEANSVERVVITSNISSMPEVAGYAACLVDPYDVEDIRFGITRVIDDEKFRERLINEGRTNKLRFNPERIANMYYDIYKEIYQQ